MADLVRWGVLGTANIAAKAFLPALSKTRGVAVAVGSRSNERGASWAKTNGVDRAGTYDSVVNSDDVDAVYVALPNNLHAFWAAVAMAAGKSVLCEKPIALSADQATELVGKIGPTGRLWESFVFLFHPQTALLSDLIEAGRIGEPCEIVSEFHFDISGLGDNIRWRRELGGGALNDVGCYPIRLARLVFGSEPFSAAAALTREPGGVDLDIASLLDFPGARRLVLSAGLRRPLSTYTRIIGSKGELRLSNPFHPTSQDTVELWSDHEHLDTWSSAPGSGFQHAIEHIHSVVAGEVSARHLAVDDAVSQARAVDRVRSAANPGNTK